ncbi:zinc-binding alcohol dehydrogenase family protein [Granulicella sp. WH15]|uniref:quinone oxidoreductase family protein n=1 Tax=Granulicella sp. WH15 TaxID=2602070 RepID=UPI0013671CFB|nr:zinc-binding alcohol dehydrogenase family protein [Granulicella sp. WH15]QHN03117.1 zinc-binding alcohol dehydrogenase family protein [Granulicella sp. WH15]
MNAAVVTTFTAPPSFTTFADPTPQQEEKLVKVLAAGLHPIVRSLANGSHYGSTGQFPFIPGVDGVGRLEDGTRVYFGGVRSPFGTMAELALASPAMCLTLPDALDDATCAGIANPAMSGWVALTARAKFVAGETVLILGATGSAGQMAVQIAKRLGAARVIAAGRNPQALEELKSLGADAVISLDQPHDALVENIRSEWAVNGVNVVLDYLWGPPAEAVFEAIAQKGLQHATSRVRHVQIGESAGRKISLPGSLLRSTALEILGSGFGSASFDQIRQAVTEFFAAAAVKPFHFEVKSAPLSDVAALWNTKEQGARLVFLP